MRLQPVPADELEASWWRRNEPRFRLTDEARLSALRRSVFTDAVDLVKPGRPIKVTTYVFAAGGVDVDAMHTLLGQHARDRGWAVDRERFTDKPVRGPLPIRPQFHSACRRASCGYVDGVLTTGRNAMPSNVEAYEAYLRWLHRHGAFVAFPKPNIGGPEWTGQ
ncbi:hypothetical protein ACIBAC_00200 [Streptomyces sp. NPDC051362]|uniref:hypothetical protein n=1 Tax=Streptomyces sp. NPDC051362 TaxID=3365651 RepID=UPI0037A8A73D